MTRGWQRAMRRAIQRWVAFVYRGGVPMTGTLFPLGIRRTAPWKCSLRAEPAVGVEFECFCFGYMLRNALFAQVGWCPEHSHDGKARCYVIEAEDYQ